MLKRLHVKPLNSICLHSLKRRCESLISSRNIISSAMPFSFSSLVYLFYYTSFVPCSVTKGANASSQIIRPNLHTSDYSLTVYLFLIIGFHCQAHTHTRKLCDLLNVCINDSIWFIQPSIYPSGLSFVRRGVDRFGSIFLALPTAHTILHSTSRQHPPA